jgi:Domain of unknown function (DUF4276)
VVIIVITHMLESWLIADISVIVAYLSERKRDAVTKQQVGKLNPKTTQDPKKALEIAFDKNSVSYYQDHKDALPIAQKIDTPRELLKQPDFQRFWTKGLDQTLSGS